jgi:hypothetical protein
MAVVEEDTVIACSPAVSKNETVGQKISHGTEQIIRSCKLYQRRENEEAIPLTEDKRDKYFIRTLMPILSGGGIIGAVAAICLETLTEPTESEVNLLRTAAVFFGEYLETM